MGNSQNSKQQRFHGGGQATGYRRETERPANVPAAPPNVPIQQVPIRQVPPSRVVEKPPRFTGGGVALGTRATNDEQKAINAAIVEAQIKEVEALLALVADAPVEVLEPALDLLYKICSAIVEKPNEAKVRKIRWNNEKVQKHLGGVPIAMDFLIASGFSIKKMPAEKSPSELEEVILFEETASLRLLDEVRKRLKKAVDACRERRMSMPNPIPSESFGSESFLSDSSSSLPVSVGEDAGPEVQVPLQEAAGAKMEEDTKEVSSGRDVQSLSDRLTCIYLTVQGANPEELLPALEMMVKICSGILDQPGNDKVRRINCKSASFQKIAKFHSLSLMLEAVGFESISDNGEELLRFPTDGSQFQLAELKSILLRELQTLRSPSTAEAPKARRIDRELLVFKRRDDGPDPGRFNVPDSYFEMTSADVKSAQSSAATKGMLMTKAMREALKPKYRFCLIRVRLTDGFIIQGKFLPNETIDAVRTWVQSCMLRPELSFYLSSMPPVKKVTEPNFIGKTLSELSLVPTSLLNFFWTTENQGAPVLKQELAAFAQFLDSNSYTLPPSERGSPAWMNNLRPSAEQQQQQVERANAVPKWLPQK
uniref:UBX domain-containing protein n=1 Tax=Guillardia theta TaxID=55529 RepID=A0A7S4NEX1_GUITH|mmetsp:Transcript_20659/g.69093  ORF Transcript_20659/g.69093 Transcript_20659/m.69093 type:complete len:595 (+) Transcript_20659:1-1785(+)